MLRRGLFWHVTPSLTRCHYTHPSLAGFLRRMLGLGEETRVGAPPTPPWACACTIVATGWVVLNVLVMGLATKPSAKTTPERKQTRSENKPRSTLVSSAGFAAACSVITRFCFRLRLLLLLLSDYWCLLNSLCGDWCRCVKALHSYRCGLDALCSDWSWLDPLCANLCRWEADPIHCHQLHVVQVDSGRHADSSLGGQG